MEESELELVPEPFRTSLRKLINRCEEAGIEYKIMKFPLKKEEERRYLRIHVQSGRDKRIIIVFDSEDAEKLNKVEFEKYVFIPRYEAICSFEYGLVEAYIKLFRLIRTDTLFSRLLNVPHHETRKMKKEDFVFEVRSQIQGKTPIIITISQPTSTALALTNRELDEESGLTVKISGLEITNSKEATDILEKLANSLFFEIRNGTGIPLMLEMYEEPWLLPKSPVFFTGKLQKAPIAFPKYQYDVDPLNLYWYATSAYEMSLLQFLAYYQVLEFYFPVYSRMEVKADVANIVKDPQFNPDHDLDINKLISSVLSKMGRGYRDEKSQLLATIKGCVQDEEVRELMSSENIKTHFQKDYKKLSKIKVSIDNKDTDLREQLAERIYDIRCRVVHTKAEEIEKERILPFTEEEALLTVEVQIIEFLARKALISGSKKFSI